jgi:hypothetical protein
MTTVNDYKPNPIDTTDVNIDNATLLVVDLLAKNVHDVWAKGRISEGWTYGPIKDSVKKETPCLVPYEELIEQEKYYDKNTAMETIKVLIKLGYKIS